MNNPTSHIFSMFPSPLFVCNYKGDTDEIIKHFDSQPLTPGDNSYGKVSENTYLLDHPICQDLSNWIKGAFEDFATHVMRYKHSGVQFTQSWLSYKHPNQLHKAHQHPNSLISGVFYYDIQEDDSPICFSKQSIGINKPFLEPSYLTDYQDHPFSQDIIYFQPKPNDLIVFPSYINHGVPPNTTNRIRKCLGINALTKGVFGTPDTVSEIIFNRHV